MHDVFGLKVQLNLFYRMDGFDLSQVPDVYYQEFAENAHWLKLSFHSDFENVKPYEYSGYDEVYTDCKKVNEQIIRFASRSALAKTTTIHYCLATGEGLKALLDNQVTGLLGLFGNSQKWERGERCLWQMKRPERVVAVDIFKAAPTADENIGHRKRETTLRAKRDLISNINPYCTYSRFYAIIHQRR